MSEVTTDPAVSLYFTVSIEGHDLGTFTGCDGLGCEVVVEQREEGGNNGFVHQLPGRIKYTNVKLTRAVNSDTAKIASWFRSLSDGVRRTTAQITALRSNGSEAWSWKLQGVVPVRWQGPSLSAESAKVATETLELAHHGFLEVAP
ncbi:MAG: phage tail protein [Streptosporangiales bacterium]|nr:phage tail protein [Streptosporangiales bacterium]